MPRYTQKREETPLTPEQLAKQTQILRDALNDMGREKQAKEIAIAQLKKEETERENAAKNAILSLQSLGQNIKDEKENFNRLVNDARRETAWLEQEKVKAIIAVESEKLTLSALQADCALYERELKKREDVMKRADEEFKAFVLGAKQEEENIRERFKQAEKQCAEVLGRVDGLKMIEERLVRKNEDSIIICENLEKSILAKEKRIENLTQGRATLEEEVREKKIEYASVEEHIKQLTVDIGKKEGELKALQDKMISLIGRERKVEELIPQLKRHYERIGINLDL